VPICRAMRVQVGPIPKPRTDLRLRMIAPDPVYVVLTVGGGRLDLRADDLGGGGARLNVPREHQDLFEAGQILGPSLLVLPNVGLPIVNPVVKWKSGSAIGIEFSGASEKQKEMIFKFLFTVERKKVRSLVS
jgi:hypothetical protein